MNRMRQGGRELMRKGRGRQSSGNKKRKREKGKFG